jgi:hypothetical protein
MNSIIKPLRWWDWVSPQGEQEMIPFLRAYVGKGMQFRTPKRKWEDLWRLKRGFLNNRLGERNFGMLSLSNFKGPKYQKGIICAAAFGVSTGTEPVLTAVTDSHSENSPTQCRNVLGYDSDGSLQWDGAATTVASITYATLTTGTDDTNNHTGEWWPDQPATNEGLNWDIQFTVDTQTGSGGGSVWYSFSTTSTNRTISTWYLLDTVSNDRTNGTRDGCWGVGRTNGTAKNPITGTTTHDGTIEIRATGSGSAVATHSVQLDAVGV